MNTVFGKSFSPGFIFATILAALPLVPTNSLAQTDNTATGSYALFNNTTGSYNTADGYTALYSNTIGGYNTAAGVGALYYNTSGNSNTGIGADALYLNTTGTYNTASGFYALAANTIGGSNTATGNQALSANMTGSSNTATGSGALYATTTGSYNTADGYGALAKNTIGSYNLAEGLSSLSSNTAGNYNVALGDYSGLKITGSSNITLGYLAGQSLTAGNNNITIANTGSAADTGVIRIGTNGAQTAAFIAGISGTGVTGGAVYVTSSGQLGVLKSSQRFKFDIKDIGAKSDRLMDLRPVMFRYKEAEEDGTHPMQYGLIAEEVAKVYPDLVQYDKQGKPFTVYYHLLTPIMLDQLQKARRQLDAQRSEFNSLKTAMQNTSSSTQAQNSAMQTQIISLRHTVQLLLMVGGALILIGLVGAAMFLASRVRSVPSWRTRQIEQWTS